MPGKFFNHREKDTPQVLVSNESNKSYQENHETSLAGQHDDSDENLEVQFSFFANGDTDGSNINLEVDNGCKNHMIKVRKVFAEVTEKI